MREVIEKHWQQSKGASTIGKEAGPGGGQLGTADQNLVWI